MPWLTSNVFIQQRNEPLSTVIEASDQRSSDQGRRRRFVHVINPYDCPEDSESRRIQELSFKSYGAARDFAAAKVDVDIVSVGYPEDDEIVPGDFRRGEHLDRSILDLATFGVPRKLPLLFDVLERGIGASSEADYAIFTNVDIVLMPQFYDAVVDLLGLGFEALTINRRTISSYEFEPRLMSLMTSDYGEGHAGFDCFVFPVDFGREFVRSDACIGAGTVMRSLLYNLVVLARPMLMLNDVHMTYHLGNDRSWQVPALEDYVDHNVAQAKRVFTALSDDASTREVIRQFCIRHDEDLEITNLRWEVTYQKLKQRWRRLLNRVGMDRDEISI